MATTRPEFSNRSLLDLGFSPTFYQFVDTIIEVKMIGDAKGYRFEPASIAARPVSRIGCARVTAEGSGRSATVTLANGDTPAILAAKLQAAFNEENVAVNASVEGGALRLTSTEYGSLGGFTIAYTDPGAEAPGTQLGLAAGSFDTGLDAAGTLDGEAMTGAGQLLTSLKGLVLRYTGTDDNATSEVRYTRGLAGSLSQSAESVLALVGGVAYLGMFAIGVYVRASVANLMWNGIEVGTISRPVQRNKFILIQYPEILFNFLNCILIIKRDYNILPA